MNRYETISLLIWYKMNIRQKFCRIVRINIFRLKKNKKHFLCENSLIIMKNRKNMK